MKTKDTEINLDKEKTKTQTTITTNKSTPGCGRHIYTPWEGELFKVMLSLLESLKPLPSLLPAQMELNNSFAHKTMYRYEPPWGTFLFNNCLVWVRPFHVSHCSIILFRD